MNNYSEQIFQSIDTIISQRLNEVKFDRTITCEVVAGIKDYPNKYWVSDGATKFQACVADASRTYKVDQKVYVLIPNGDYNSADKVIIGSYTADELPKNLYTNPFDHLVYSSKVLFGPYTLDKCIETSIDTGSLVLVDEREIAFNYSNSTPFDYIGLDFSFNTTDLYGMEKGNYGIQFTLKNNDIEIFTSAIDSSQLYGDIYNFNSLMKMQHLFPIPTEVDITQANKLVINLYQKGNFDIAEKKIYLKEASFYFGYDVEKINSNKLVLHLDKSQSLTFKDSEKRNFYLEWQDTDLNKIYTSSKTDAPTYEYEIYWCHYEAGYKKTKEDDIEETGVYWKTLIKNTEFKYQADLKKDNQREQFKVGIRYYDKTEEIKKWKYIESNALIFTNEDVKAEPGSTNNSEDSIKLTCSDSGVYNYYNSYGQIIDNSYLRKKRTITAEFLDGYKITDAASIEWAFPESNTMISKVEETKETTTFRILDNYIPGIKDNNTIYCTATLPSGEIRRGKITLHFGDARIVGSNYSFNINFVAQNYACFTTIGDSIAIRVNLERLDGETITDKPDIEWKLVEGDFVSVAFNKDGYTAKVTLESMPNEGKNHIVLVATIKDYTLDNGLTSDLVAYLSIPIGSSSYSHITGPTRLIYNSAGNALEAYSKEPYQLVKSDGTIEKEVISWEIEELDNAPKLKKVEKTGLYFLQPLAQAPDEMPIVCLTAKKNGTVVWQQPILSLKDRYLSNWLNEWNGKFTIDKENNYLMTASIAAGIKTDNKFSGVTIGELRDTADKTISTTGLFGFDEGVIRFYLNREGEFFVGDEEANYLSFKNDEDTNKKVFKIKTNVFDLDTDKLKINNNGITFLDKNNDVLFNLDAKATIPTATIGGWGIDKNKIYYKNSDGTNIKDVYIANSGSYCFYSEGKNGIFKVGFYGDMFCDSADIKGKITASAGKIANFDINGYSLIGTAGKTTVGLFAYPWYYHENNPNTGRAADAIVISNDGKYPFVVRKDGKFFATDAEITGKITSSSGSIGGWIIDNGRIYNTNSSTGYTFNLWNPETAGGDIIACTKGGEYPFHVTREGKLYATSATIKGTLQAGTIIQNSTNTATTKIGTFTVQTYSTGTTLNHTNTSNSAYSSLMYCINGAASLSATAPSGHSASVTANASDGILSLSGTKYCQANGVQIGSSGSDKKIKHDINNLSEKYSIFFDQLRPVSFIYNENSFGYGSSQRTHTGFIANEVETALTNSNLTTQEFAGFVHQEATEEYEDLLCLRYEEFIALNTWQIQKLKQRVTELENEIKEIKQNENN